MSRKSEDIDAILDRLEVMEGLAQEVLIREAKQLAAEQLSMAERVLKTWIIAHDGAPGDRPKEGFLLLALHRQGAKGDPSFNACRETCREVVFHYNLVASAQSNKELVNALRLMVMVVRHLAYFVSGKLNVAGLGEFCCASKSLRQTADALMTSHGV